MIHSGVATARATRVTVSVTRAGRRAAKVRPTWTNSGAISTALSRLFGGAGGSGGGDGAGGGPRNGRQAGIGVLVVVAAVFLIWVGTGFYIVQEGQVGVVSTFGRYSSTTPAGLQWRAP